MTPQLQQAIKLLQLSNLELAAEIDRELEQNPLLDRDEGANDTLLEGPSEDQQGTGVDSAAEGDAGDSPHDLESGLEGSSLDVADRDVVERSAAEQLPTAGDEPPDTDYENPRSEERRRGKECVSTFRSRWSPDPQITNKTTT